MKKIYRQIFGAIDALFSPLSCHITSSLCLPQLESNTSVFGIIYIYAVVGASLKPIPLENWS